MAVNSANFGSIMLIKARNIMKHLFIAFFAMSVAISTPLLADEATDRTYPQPGPYQSPAPYYAPPSAGTQSPAPYCAVPPTRDQYPAPYYAPPRYLPTQPSYVLRPYKTDPLFTLVDILIYRPIGLAVTIAGAGILVGTSPLIALASIPQPHDAFPQAFDILVNTPAIYTFYRPLGDRSLPYYQYLR